MNATTFSDLDVTVVGHFLVALGNRTNIRKPSDPKSIDTASERGIGDENVDDTADDYLHCGTFTFLQSIHTNICAAE
jgi:hypothetical protein